MKKVCQTCREEKDGTKFERGQYICKSCSLRGSLKETFGDVFLEEELEVLAWTLGDV